ncbi:hypothetical protein DFH27DRAFT_524308 [Peziza echinospora]|nr:hypothetical protein DFH27DRAFT_524308 [Peziza echinospora]
MAGHPNFLLNDLHHISLIDITPENPLIPPPTIHDIHHPRGHPRNFHIWLYGTPTHPGGLPIVELALRSTHFKYHCQGRSLARRRALTLPEFQVELEKEVHAMTVKRLQYMRTNHYALAVAEGERVLEMRRRAAREVVMEQRRGAEEVLGLSPSPSPSPRLKGLDGDGGVHVERLQEAIQAHAEVQKEPGVNIANNAEAKPMASQNATGAGSQEEEDDDDWLSDVDAPHELVSDDEVPDVQSQQRFWHELLLKIRREQFILGVTQSDDLGEIDEKMINEWADYYGQ